MFWPEVWVGQLLDGCFRIGHVLQWICSAPRRAKLRRGKPDKVHRPQQEPCRSEQLDQRGLKEALTPGAANGQALVERLPAHPHLGYECIRIII